MSIDYSRPRTEWDSHKNMVVVGKNYSIISNTTRKYEFIPFTSNSEALQEVPIVDDATLYMCSYTIKPCLLIVSNRFSIPYMKHNIILILIVREYGVEVNSNPNIQSKGPEIEYHYTYFRDDDFRIPLSLWGIFSYFPMSNPTK